MSEHNSHVGAHSNSNSPGVRILFWNLRSAVNKKAELQKLTEEYDVIVLAETWLNKNSSFEFGQFHTYSLPRADGPGGGLAFIVHNSLQYTLVENINEVNGAEIGGIKITNLAKPLTIFAVYRPPGNGSLTDSAWKDIVGNTNGHSHCLLVGDFNAHNEAWNCSHTDPDGARLLDSFEALSLFLHNHDTYTHFNQSNLSRSNIDLVLSSTDLSSFIETEVFSDSWGSDHFPINIMIDVHRYIYRRETFKIQSKRTDWTQVNSKLDEDYPVFLKYEYDHLAPVEKYHFFMDTITNAVSQATPKRKTVSAKLHKNPVPWWDDECHRAKRRRQAAFKKWEFSRQEEDRLQYNKLRTEARKIFRHKKRECYRQFASTIDFRHDITYTWNKARIFKNKWTKVKKEKSCNAVDKSKLEEALDKICPSSAPSNPATQPQSKNDPMMDNLFTFAEFNTALSSRGDKSAPGRDGINYEVLHNISIKYHLLLLDILNEMFVADQYPDTWRETFVHFADKPNGKGYRPLALTSCVCKIFELMVSNRLRWFVETNDLLPRTQMGFRKGFSCSDNLTIFKLDIEDALKEGSQVLAVYLDVSNAFNEVQSEILIKKLACVNISTKLIKFVKFLTYHREVYTEVNPDTPRHCYKGVPQGGVLSPLMYLLYVADAVKVDHARVKILQYADDIVIYLRTDDPNSDKSILEDAVQEVATNLGKIGLEVSPVKTEVVHFNKQGIAPGETTLQVHGFPVVSTDAVKLLGIHFDYQMNFKKHLRYVVQRSSASLNIIKFLRGVYWGADPSTLIGFYKSFTRSIIDYGSYIYFPTTKNSILKLERIQFAAIRLSHGLRISTPTNILLAESNLTTLRIRSELLCSQFLLKAFSRTQTITRVTLDSHVRKIIVDRRQRTDGMRKCIKRVVGIRHEIHQGRFASVYNHHFDIFRTPINVDYSLGISLRDSDYPNLLLQTAFLDTDSIKIYTDGSKKDKGLSVGAACVVPELELINTDSLNPKSSIFTAESRALSLAMDIALENSHRNVDIFSDSLSALKAISSPKIQDSMNHHLLQVLHKNLQYTRSNFHTRNLTLHWVPSHIGITGNELADSEAKRATEAVPSTTRLPYMDHRAFFRKLAWSENTRLIEEEGLSKGITYFQRIRDQTPKPWYKGLKLKRDMFVFISRCRSNHYSLNQSLHRINVVDDPSCECGYECQDLNHVIWQCSQYNQQRETLLKKMSTMKLFPPFDVVSFLCKPNIEVLHHIFCYLKDIDKKI